MNYKYLFKYIIIGDTGVGKSCLLSRFTEDRFRQKHEVTIGVEFGAQIIELNKVNIKLQIWDTAGQESFRSITRTYYRNAAGALLVFDVTRKETFDHLQEWLNEVQENGNENISMILVGNKCDLKEERQITQKQAEQFARENGLQYVEVSAKNDDNVSSAFEKVAQQIYDKIQNGTIDIENEMNGVKEGNSPKTTLGDEQKKKKNCC